MPQKNSGIYMIRSKKVKKSTFNVLIYKIWVYQKKEPKTTFAAAIWRPTKNFMYVPTVPTELQFLVQWYFVLVVMNQRSILDTMLEIGPTLTKVVHTVIVEELID